MISWSRGVALAALVGAGLAVSGISDTGPAFAGQQFTASQCEHAYSVWDEQHPESKHAERLEEIGKLNDRDGCELAFVLHHVCVHFPSQGPTESFVAGRGVLASQFGGLVRGVRRCPTNE
jgi:hypothetical protein